MTNFRGLRAKRDEKFGLARPSQVAVGKGLTRPLLAVSGRRCDRVSQPVVEGRSSESRPDNTARKIRKFSRHGSRASAVQPSVVVTGGAGLLLRISVQCPLGVGVGTPSGPSGWPSRAGHALTEISGGGRWTAEMPSRPGSRRLPGRLGRQVALNHCLVSTKTDGRQFVVCRHFSPVGKPILT